nr:protein-glutamate O-methyltransferase CheR [Planctomycetota bacterium]
MAVSPTSFEWVRSLLAERAGNALPADKVYLVETRLTPIAKKAGAAGVDSLVAELRATPDFERERQIVEAMLTHESSFFRDEDTFKLLGSTLLPELIEQRQDCRKLAIWSAACAAGQEPCSVAMLIEEQFPGLADWEVPIVATDFSRRTLAQARTGLYTESQIQRGLTHERKQRFFREEHNRWQISEDLLNSIEYSQINLCDEPPPLPQFDLILLRNVLIYLTVEARQQ